MENMAFRTIRQFDRGFQLSKYKFVPSYTYTFAITLEIKLLTNW